MTFDKIEQDNLAESKPKAKSKPKPILKLVVDPGTSLSKILYVVNSDTVKWMTMGAEYLTLPRESAKSLPIDNGMGQPEDNAWVRLSKSGECHAVGFVASNYRATASIKKLKHESLPFKILAAVGAIAQREKLGNNFKLKLGILLPYSEYRSSHDWSSELKTALSSFWFQAQLLKIKLSSFSCKPEGYGIAKFTNRCESADYFHQGNTAVVMLGYRNTSCLFFRRGTVSKPESGTTDLGFYTLLDKLIEKIPSMTRSDILKAMSSEFEESYGRVGNNQTYFSYKESSATINFASLVKSAPSELVEKEMEKIKNAYDLSLNEYWSLLKNWLSETLPRTSEIDAFVLAGGSCDLLSNHFSSYVNSLSAKCFCTNSANELKRYLLYGKDPRKERFMRESLAVRFADVWGFFVPFVKYDLNLILDRNTGEVISDGK
ncbi:MAG: ParM/StbA family protein [Pleurocapsa sp. MO_192.B19]|nr:ParM/StbA family protein [Pleurocapsa sp. MO_192.B19]